MNWSELQTVALTRLAGLPEFTRKAVIRVSYWFTKKLKQDAAKPASHLWDTE
jgi:hypothetical protein